MAACKSVSDTKAVVPGVKQPVFLRSMSAPSDLEMIANQDLEFPHSSQRFTVHKNLFDTEKVDYKHNSTKLMMDGESTHPSTLFSSTAGGDTIPPVTVAAPSHCCSL